MSALPPRADIECGGRHVRLVPLADSWHRSKEYGYSISSISPNRLSLRYSMMLSSILRNDSLRHGRNGWMLSGGVAMPEPDHRFKITEMGLQIDPHSLRAWISCITQDGESLLLETDRVELQELCQEIQRQIDSRPLPG